jgi:twitching motility two-component system response regulator PilG
MMRKIHWHKGFDPLSLAGEMLPGAPKRSWMDDLSTRHPTQTGEASANPFVMVIDDSATVRIIIETCLRREGFVVRSFHDGIDALHWLSRPDAALPALIFLDVCLPRMDGYDVARQLKAQPTLKATVIVMLSRRDGLLDRLKGRLAGAREYLTKPFNTYDLLQMVETHLGRRGERIC